MEVEKRTRGHTLKIHKKGARLDCRRYSFSQNELRGKDTEESWGILESVIKESVERNVPMQKVFKTLTPLNTILLSGPLLLNSFIDPDTFGKSCISFKPLNLDQKHVISK